MKIADENFLPSIVENIQNLPNIEKFSGEIKIILNTHCGGITSAKIHTIQNINFNLNGSQKKEVAKF